MTFKACVRFRSQDGGGRRKYFIQVKNLETLCSNDRRAISMARTTQQKKTAMKRHFVYVGVRKS